MSFKSFYRKLRWSFFWDHYQLPEIDVESFVPVSSWFDPPILENIYLPPYEGPSTHDDVRPLLSFVKMFNPKTVLELGTAFGNTVANICAISQAKVFTVNALPEQIEGGIITIALSKNEIGYVFRKYGFEDRVVQIFANTRDLNILDYCDPGSIDFILIDACHDVDFVISDFLMIQPLVHEETVVFLHDVHPSATDHLADSYIACMYLRKMGYNTKHLKNTWWGIWTADQPYIKDAGLFQNMINKIDTYYVKIINRSYFQDALNLRYHFKIISK